MNQIDEDFEFGIAFNNTASIKRYKGHDKVVLIPLMHGGRKVESIADSAFKDNLDIQEINLFNNVKEIGPSAFEGCFHLKKVKRFNNIKRIESRAFFNCKSLIEAPIPSKPMEYIGDSAFEGCDSILSFEIVNLKNKQVTIGDRAFCNCNKLSRFNIQCVKLQLGKFAFANCPGLLEVETDADTIIVEEGCFYSCTNLKTALLYGLREIKDLAFIHCDKLEVVVFYDYSDIKASNNCFPKTKEGYIIPDLVKL